MPAAAAAVRKTRVSITVCTGAYTALPYGGQSPHEPAATLQVRSAPMYKMNQQQQSLNRPAVVRLPSKILRECSHVRAAAQGQSAKPTFPDLCRPPPPADI